MWYNKCLYHKFLEMWKNTEWIESINSYWNTALQISHVKVGFDFIKYLFTPQFFSPNHSVLLIAWSLSWLTLVGSSAEVFKVLIHQICPFPESWYCASMFPHKSVNLKVTLLIVGLTKPTAVTELRSWNNLKVSVPGGFINHTKLWGKLTFEAMV